MTPAAPKKTAKIAVILVAAGRGSRLGGPTPKQYIELAGRSPIRRAAEVFLSVAGVDLVLPVIHPDDTRLCANALSGISDARLREAVHGADTRAGSVRAGLEALRSASPDLVLIHDAARPFVSTEVIERVIGALEMHDGAFAALPVVDALWTVEDGLAETPVPRAGVWRAQTPQGFRFPSILDAHLAHDGQGADDVEVARAAGLTVAAVEGSDANYKITTAADLARAEIDAARRCDP